ncbi:hypothetical protein O181_001980 [Austropuccinia psidii MF-1]|uniref:Uncharacterized protein n=1 Tax=Austropuccinia psidii MF-1 TaxID=1389203 RepID=A0A9Q3GCD8_9BASI|nr:hypothetical protein [Austropuccinia psidii MF-1]
MMDSNLHHPHSHPITEPYKNLWKERLPLNLTKAHPSFPRLGRETHYNQLNLGTPQIQTPPSNSKITPQTTTPSSTKTPLNAAQQTEPCPFPRTFMPKPPYNSQHNRD